MTHPTNREPSESAQGDPTMKKGKMTEAEKQAWWAANKAKAAAKKEAEAKRLAKRQQELDKRNREINDPNSEYNKELRKWHPYFYGDSE